MVGCIGSPAGCGGGAGTIASGLAAGCCGKGATAATALAACGLGPLLPTAMPITIPPAISATAAVISGQFAAMNPRRRSGFPAGATTGCPGTNCDCTVP